MEYENLTIETFNNICIVTINRPEKLNALNSQTLDELEDAFLSIKKNDDIFVSIITGSGDKAFVAGADIKELKNQNAISAKYLSEKGQAIFNLIEQMDKPVIAAVNGFALGGGCELAMACNFRTASENARFGQPEVNLGIIPGYGGTQRLSRIISKGRASELILTGDMIDANEALRIGLVNKVFKPEELINETKAIAEKIASKGQLAVRMAVKSINASQELSLSEGQNYEATLFGLCAGTKDFIEGTSAFLEKRKANFKNN